jgi:hypothetical protein
MHPPIERPSSTSTSSAQVDGQSCGQTDERRSMRETKFMRYCA